MEIDVNIKCYATSYESVHNALGRIARIYGVEHVQVINRYNTRDICEDITNKLIESEIVYKGFHSKKETVVVVDQGGKFLIGRAKRNDSDEDDYTFGVCLAICRAMKWKELEKQLLDSLE